MTDRAMLLERAPLALVRRIDIGLEGSWSDAVTAVPFARAVIERVAAAQQT